MGRLRLAAGLAAAAFLLLAGTGCGERREPTAASAVRYPLTVRGAGERPLTLRESPSRIAAITLGAAQILARLARTDRLVGPSRTLDSNGRIRIRELRRDHPDLIVASPFTDAVDLAQARRVAPAPVYFAPESSIHDVERAATELGLLVGKPLVARAIVGSIEHTRRSVATTLAGARPVSVFVDTGFFTTVSTRSLIGDLVREAHGGNIAGRHTEPGPFSLHQLRRLDPEVYIATSDSETTLRSLRSDPRTRKLRAVRTGRVVVVPVDLLEPGPKIGQGLAVIARHLHPDAFR